MNYQIKVINNEQEYSEALALAKELMLRDPEPDSEDGEKLKLVATLIEEYESRLIPESLPDPIEAILFRMEQQNLKPSDLIPYLGSRSKVSEILSRKRPLTLAMIRSLEVGLGIPAKVLLQDTDNPMDPKKVIWERFPLREMVKRGYLSKKILKTTEVKLALKNLLKPIYETGAVTAMLRKTHYRFSRPVDKYALAAWTALVINKVKKYSDRLVKYKSGTVNLEFMTKVARLSSAKNGPLLARDYLKEHGIAFVYEPHFEHTYLDGAMLVVDNNNPIIALTIRHDRLDNFWFTLMHELAHISLHLDKDETVFYDDLDNKISGDGKELEADKLASEALIPKVKWENSPAKLIPSAIAAESLAKELGINSVIVAGRIRHEGGRYVFLSKMINEAKVKNLFIE